MEENSGGRNEAKRWWLNTETKGAGRPVHEKPG